MFGPNLVFTSFCFDYAVEKRKITVTLFGFLLLNLKGH